ncbi:MAG: hypothetical protein E7066_10730 [Lentimicrobiaceae bacterium]|nr:hypothetical protein [Lentimicrobiaceae bacterium]
MNDTDPRNWKYYKREFISDYVALIEAFEKVNPDVEIYICRMTPIFHWHHRFKKRNSRLVLGDSSDDRKYRI